MKAGSNFGAAEALRLRFIDQVIEGDPAATVEHAFEHLRLPRKRQLAR